MAKKLQIPPPSEKQKQFLTAKTKHIGFGGARGGGKSWAVRIKAVLLALFFGGIRILIVRRTYPELVNNHINILRKMLIGIATYNDKDKVLKFRNGSTINFTYCARDGDLDRLGSLALPHLRTNDVPHLIIPPPDPSGGFFLTNGIRHSIMKIYRSNFDLSVREK